jgi:hypothetical protein
MGIARPRAGKNPEPCFNPSYWNVYVGHLQSEKVWHVFLSLNFTVRVKRLGSRCRVKYCDREAIE